jgi:hypothetical protein
MSLSQKLTCLIQGVQEDRHKFTKAKWSGDGFRYYRDPKIVRIVHYRPKPRAEYPAKPAA